MTKSNMKNLLNEEEELNTSGIIPIVERQEEEVVVEKGAAVTAKEMNTADSTQTVTKKVPDRRGVREKKEQKFFTDIGLSVKYLPPLTRKRTAIYQQVNEGKRIDIRLEGRDRFVDPPPLQLHPHYSFNDGDETNFSLSEKTLTYYEGGSELITIEDPVTKRTRQESVKKIGFPEFIGGQKTVSIFGEYSRYVWWELHPRNGTNKWRDKSKSPLFERVDIQYATPHLDNIKLDLQREAESYVLALKPDELINLGSAMTNPTINTMVNPQELRLVLRTRARLNPEEILFTSTRNSGSTKVACIHALELGILTYVPEYNAYYYRDEKESVFKVPIDNNPFDSLCQWLMDKAEGQDLFQSIREDLSFWF